MEAVLTDLEWQLNNAARRAARAGEQERSSAYRYAALLVRKAIKDAA